MRAMHIDAPESLWRPPSEFLALSCDEVHIWRASLDLPPSRFQTLEQTLAADERTRAEQFRFEKDRTIAAEMVGVGNLW